VGVTAGPRQRLGTFYSEHGRRELNDPTFCKLVRTLFDHVIEVGDGDEVDDGILESGIGSGYAKYMQIHSIRQYVVGRSVYVGA